ncbi:hypothetical protein Ae717Ps2_6121 [Pseudonocardia sp. Ae717_Ps2]|nr:hypothetical protein Ae717Ps2_6811 [Pseudonocardia sp. Ae717_Ps2]OLM28802.1 hypothetical protein Ae717Ps2_6121 [Pseudonocardia sp. Ae717_Ps2]
MSDQDTADQEPGEEVRNQRNRRRKWAHDGFPSRWIQAVTIVVSNGAGPGEPLRLDTTPVYPGPGAS